MPRATPLTDDKLHPAAKAKGGPWVFICMGGWFLAVFCVFGWMAREKAQAAKAGWAELRRDLLAAPGWTMRHVLPGDAKVSRAVVEHLLARGRMPALREEIVVDFQILPLELRVRADEAGWPLRDQSSALREGFLEIRRPDGSAAWRGVYKNADFALGAPSLREDVVLAAAKAGQSMPPVVPAFCAVSGGASGFRSLSL